MITEVFTLHLQESGEMYLESIFVPAGMKIDFKGQAEILYAYV